MRRRKYLAILTAEPKKKQSVAAAGKDPTLVKLNANATSTPDSGQPQVKDASTTIPSENSASTATATSLKKSSETGQNSSSTNTSDPNTAVGSFILEDP